MKDIISATEKFKEIYGIDYPMQSPEIVKNRVRSFRSSKDLLIEDRICKGIIDTQSGSDAVLKNIVFDTLGKLNQICEKDKDIGKYTYDIFLSDKKLLIQICPTITHNDILSFDETGRGISSMQHKQEAEYAYDLGYECIHIFDWDDISTILNVICNSEPIHTTCYAEKIDRFTYETFCFQYYIGNPNKYGTYFYGIYSDENLLAVASFRKSTSKQYDWELVRYCETGYTYESSYLNALITKFHEDVDFDNIVIYVDQSKYFGRGLLNAGFKYIKSLYPQRIWSKNTERLLHASISGRQYDDIFHTNYNSDHSLYTQMIEHGWLPVYDCGKKVYVYSEV